MARLFLLLGCLAGGTLTGGAAALAVTTLLPGTAGTVEPATGPLQFVKMDPLLAPLVFEDGQLAGYATFEIQLQVAEDSVEDVTARLPLLIHALNLQTYRVPLAAGSDGQLPDLHTFRRLVAREADGVFGRGMVRQVAITQARPA